MEKNIVEKESKNRKAKEYKLAIESIDLLTRHSKFEIKTKRGGYNKTWWEVHTMGKKFSGYDFIGVVREAVIFVAKANDVITKDELDKLNLEQEAQECDATEAK